MPQTASQISRCPLSTDQVVSTGSIRVKLIYVSNATLSPSEVVFVDNDDSPILNMMVAACDSDNFSGDWIAGNGLKILGLSAANVVVTVLHGAEGA